MEAAQWERDIRIKAEANGEWEPVFCDTKRKLWNKTLKPHWISKNHIIVAGVGAQFLVRNICNNFTVRSHSLALSGSCVCVDTFHARLCFICSDCALFFFRLFFFLHFSHSTERLKLLEPWLNVSFDLRLLEIIECKHLLCFHVHKPSMILRRASFGYSHFVGLVPTPFRCMHMLPLKSHNIL